MTASTDTPPATTVESTTYPLRRLPRLTRRSPRSRRQNTPVTPRRGGTTLVLTLILVCQLMVVLDATIVNIALPDIRADLGFSAAGLSWVVNAYTLTFGGLLLLGARAGDILGRRRVFLAGIALFTCRRAAGCTPRAPRHR